MTFKEQLASGDTFEMRGWPRGGKTNIEVNNVWSKALVTERETRKKYIIILEPMHCFCAQWD